MRSWCRVDDELMTSWCRVDDELMTSWWGVDAELMTSWWYIDDVLMTCWWRVVDVFMTSWVDVKLSQIIIKLSSNFNMGVYTWKDKDTLSHWKTWSSMIWRNLIFQIVNANLAKFSPDRPGLAWDRPGSTWDRPGSTWDRPGSTGDRPGIGQSISADLGRYILWGGDL